MSSPAELEKHGAAGMCSSESQNNIAQKRHFHWQRGSVGGTGGDRIPELGEGGAVGEGGRCMIKAHVLKSLTSPLVWLMVPASQTDRSKGLEKWCNYCFLNRGGKKKPVWSAGDSTGRRLAPFYPTLCHATHPQAPRHHSILPIRDICH